MDKLTVSLRKKPPLSVSINARTIPPVTEELRVTPSETEQVFTAEGNVTGYSPVVVEGVDMPEIPLWTNAGRMYFKNLVIPDGVTSIGTEGYYGTFRDCQYLETVTVPNSVTIMWNGSFSECVNLSTVNFGTGLTTLHPNAFSNCSSLVEVNLINTRLTTISPRCFYGCSALTTLSLPNSLTTVTTPANSQNSFFGCSALSYVTLEDGFLCNLNLSYSTQFSANSIIVMLNALGEVPDGETRTLTLGSTNLAKLTDAQKQIATDKGWTLA